MMLMQILVILTLDLLAGVAGLLLPRVQYNSTSRDAQGAQVLLPTVRTLIKPGQHFFTSRNSSRNNHSMNYTVQSSTQDLSLPCKLPADLKHSSGWSVLEVRKQELVLSWDRDEAEE